MWTGLRCGEITRKTRTADGMFLPWREEISARKYPGAVLDLISLP
jgi:hypothetical protein